MYFLNLGVKGLKKRKWRVCPHKPRQFVDGHYIFFFFAVFVCSVIFCSSWFSCLSGVADGPPKTWTNASPQAAYCSGYAVVTTITTHPPRILQKVWFHSAMKAMIFYQSSQPKIKQKLSTDQTELHWKKYRCLSTTFPGDLVVVRGADYEFAALCDLSRTQRMRAARALKIS